MGTFTLKRWVPLLSAVALCVTGCGDKGAGPNKPETWTPIFGTFTDLRDNTEYKTVKLNKATWMAENLNYVPDSGISMCYDCAKYGRLYNWTTAMKIDMIYEMSRWGGSDVGHQGICPAGWHLPSRSEWENLFKDVGGKAREDRGIFWYDDIGKKLKAKNGWNNNGNGTDDYGFTALPGGTGGSNGGIAGGGEMGFWWTATESGNETGKDALNIRLYDDLERISISGYPKWGYAYSVRCVQNNE